MSASTDPVELLERAVSYTRGALMGVGADLTVPTPCRRWDLGQLLDHMADGLDAFVEASSGFVDISVTPRPAAGSPPGSAANRVGDLQASACALLAAWTADAAPTGTGERVRLGDAALHAEILLRAGALEIAVHGWDVAAATGRRTPIPDALAAGLLPNAELLVSSADRGVRFADPVRVDPECAPGRRLLGFVGRAA